VEDYAVFIIKGKKDGVILILAKEAYPLDHIVITKRDTF
jgi:hypothetical protein